MSFWSKWTIHLLSETLKLFHNLNGRVYQVCQLRHTATVMVPTILLTSVKKRQLKGKGHPTTGHEGPEAQQIYSSILPLNSALAGGWSRPHLRHFTSGNEAQNPLCRRPGGPHCRPGRVQKISHPPEFDPRNVQPVASRYTDWVTRPTLNTRLYINTQSVPRSKHTPSQL